MMGDYQVWLCERLGVKLPLSTRRQGLATVTIKNKKFTN